MFVGRGARVGVRVGMDVSLGRGVRVGVCASAGVRVAVSVDVCVTLGVHVGAGMNVDSGVGAGSGVEGVQAENITRVMGKTAKSRLIRYPRLGFRSKTTTVVIGLLITAENFPYLP